MKNLIFTLFLTTVVSLVQAQSAFVGGVILDQNDSPVQGAKIELTGENTYGAITNAQGRFRIANVKPGAYSMLISSVGYDSLSQNIEVAAPFTRLDPISLEPKSFKLGEVTIEGEVAQAMQKGDTTQYNAGAFKTNPDATAEDLIQKMPGVVVQNGTVQAQGEDVKQILVDGKPFFGNDPNAALKNLPAEVISKIEVFDQQSEQSKFTGVDDGETTKTINIVTRTEMRNGQFGKLYAGYGYEDKYKGGGSFNHFDDDRRLTILAQANNINQQNFATEDLAGIVSTGRGGRGRGGRGGGGGPGGGGPGGWGGGDANNFLVNQQGGISTTKAFGLNYSDKWGKKTSVTGSYFFNQTDNVSIEDLNRIFILDSDSGQTYVEKSAANSQNI
ncbi:MAG: carboxypeptidase-like regulatory domain-containing protein, partial [Bacteroidetes bacterium]|nr:carboxypeptidase-like regulatory domain-containing protein [Bacteroidota bacterium]